MIMPTMILRIIYTIMLISVIAARPLNAPQSSLYRPAPATLTIITGSTGVLGRAILQRTLAYLQDKSHNDIKTPVDLTEFNSGTHVIGLLYRNPSKLSLLPPIPQTKELGSFTLLQTESFGTHDLPSLCASLANRAKETLDSLEVDVRTARPSSPPFSAFKRVNLINAAGVCLQGTGSDVISDSVRINSLLPVLLGQQILSMLYSPSPAIAAASLPTIKCINISSGDGELCYLRSDLAESIRRLGNIYDWEAYCSTIASEVGSIESFSYGSNPAYALSKALLTKGTALLSQTFSAGFSDNHTALSLCPGNFLSPMTNSDDIDTGVRPVEEAAEDVLDMIIRADVYENGQFYRYREVAQM